jgi:hypothetical protein
LRRGLKECIAYPNITPAPHPCEIER